MDELFEELVGYLMQEDEANIQENTNHEAHNSITDGIDDDNLMTVAMMDSFNINVDNNQQDGECYNPHMDLHCTVDDYDYQLDALLYDDCLADLPLLDAISGNFQEDCVTGIPSGDRIQCDRLLPDVTDTSLETCDIDQYFNLMESSTMQQKTDTDVCCEPHQTQSSSPAIPDHQPHQQQQVEEEKRQQELGTQALIAPADDRNEEDMEEEEEEDVLLANEATADDEDIGDDVDTTSKNLRSERNRRKRLNQQYLTLRSIVPNITKMDKRTVLVDALAYLQDIVHQTQIEIENQNKVISSLNNSSLAKEKTINLPLHHHNEDVVPAAEKNVLDVSGNDGQVQPLFHTLLVEPPGPPPFERRAIFPAIMQMETGKLDEERYVLTIVFNKALGTMGLVQRSVEMLKGFESINVALSTYDEHHMQSSNFIRVKKIKGSLLQTNEEDLLNRAKESVKQLGLLFLRFVSSTDDL
ncbi:hypothetical protein MKW98_006085 [Papaver atlanticum]|uniref:BHLH domain-containing protein n=1 Tax=Papaver atlanticum TaxID=357466 RepID=A0AAD4TGS6_9MAGN|nr:hypothetical protein MKW98_006085 [Papaver atlanticum]